MGSILDMPDPVEQLGTGGVLVRLIDEIKEDGEYWEQDSYDDAFELIEEIKEELHDSIGLLSGLEVEPELVADMLAFIEPLLQSSEIFLGALRSLSSCLNEGSVLDLHDAREQVNEALRVLTHGGVEFDRLRSQNPSLVMAC